MRPLVASVLVCLPLSVASADDKEVSLFDGQSLSGWHVMNGGKFEAKDGMIQLRGGSGWLRSDQEYADFVLTLEVRWLKPKQDSGVFLRSGIEGKNWPDKKIEVQVENTERVAMLFGAKHKLDKAKAAKALKPVNEWNEYVIRCVGKECEVKLNGEVVCTSDEVKLEKGHLGFQGENGDLDFRNIRIRVVNKK
ncbi:MAG: DUF1080 domain-containing protein [Gemmataceae bacterium]